MLRAGTIHLIALATLCGALSSCNTPQIPLPPPRFSSFAVEVNASEQEVRIQGRVGLAGGQLFIIDPVTHNGIIRNVRATGEFDTGFFSASDGQKFDVYYGDGIKNSDSACMQVSYSPPGAAKCQP